MEEFRRILTDSQSNSRDKKRVAAIKTFNEFLHIGSSTFLSWSDFSPSTPITKDIYEQYCSFLVQQCKTLGTAEAYASAIRGIVEMEFGSDHPIVKDSRWYKNVRRELVKAFVHKCQLNNTSLVNRATPADKELIASLCSLLFQKGERDSFHDRFLLSTQWQALGRPGELGLLSVSDFSWSHAGNCLLGDWSRFKANQESVSQISFFASNLVWQLDIFHCIGSWNACFGDSSDKAYPLLKECNVHAYVNRVLKNVLDGEEVDYTLTGYSLSRGGASTAAQNEHLAIYQIIQRGGWTIDAVSTIFEYICGTTYSDHKVAKVLAGWDNPSCGGFPPNFSFLQGDEEGLRLIWRFTHFLFHQCSSDWVREVHEHACASLLMYLPETKTFNPLHILHTTIEEAAVTCGISVEVICTWSNLIRNDFVVNNLPALPLKVIEEMDPVLAERISVRQETFMQFLANQTKSLFLLHQANLQLATHVRHMNMKLESMEKMMQHLLLSHGGLNGPDVNESFGGCASVGELNDCDGHNVQDDGATIKIPYQLQSLKNTSLRNAFSLWYLERVYLVHLSEDNKKIIEPLARAVDAMKRFLAVGSVIPSWVHPDDVQYDLYKSIIHGLAVEGETGLLDFCKQWKEVDRERNQTVDGSKKSRTRNIESNLYGRVKDVCKAESNGFMLPPMPEIFDESNNDVLLP